MERPGMRSALLLTLVLAASSVAVASIFLSGNLFGGNQQNVATAASLPYRTDLHVQPKVLTGDAALGAPYFRIEPHWMDNFGENHCEECTMIEYNPGPKGTAGVAYTADKVYDFSEATRAVIFVRGESGGEKISFGLVGKDMPAGTKIPTDANLVSEKIQFATKTKEVTLENDWQRVEIPLGGDKSKMKYPFSFQINSNDKVRFYVSGVFFDSEPIKAPLKYDELNAAK